LAAIALLPHLPVEGTNMKTFLFAILMTFALLGTASATQPLTEQQIKNMTIPAAVLKERAAVTFVNGGASGSLEPNGPLANDPMMQWTMNIHNITKNSSPAPSKPEAAITLVSNFGGTGWYVTLCSVYNHHGRAVAGSCTTAGEIAINSVKLNGTKLIVDGDQHGPNDAHCCPTYRYLYTYEVQKNKLALKSDKYIGRHAE
jgi:hypothetical protein